MQQWSITPLLLASLLVAGAGTGITQPQQLTDRALIVGTKHSPPLLRYLTTTLPGRVDVSPAPFERQDYGMAAPSGRALREPSNRVLLDTLTQSAWQDLLYRHMGTQ